MKPSWLQDREKDEIKRMNDNDRYTKKQWNNGEAMKMIERKNTTVENRVIALFAVVVIMGMIFAGVYVSSIL